MVELFDLFTEVELTGLVSMMVVDDNSGRTRRSQPTVLIAAGSLRFGVLSVLSKFVLMT